MIVFSVQFVIVFLCIEKITRKKTTMVTVTLICLLTVGIFGPVSTAVTRLETGRPVSTAVIGGSDGGPTATTELETEGGVTKLENVGADRDSTSKTDEAFDLDLFQRRLRSSKPEEPTTAVQRMSSRLKSKTPPSLFRHRFQTGKTEIAATRARKPARLKSPPFCHVVSQLKRTDDKNHIKREEPVKITAERGDNVISDMALVTALILFGTVINITALCLGFMMARAFSGCAWP